MAVYGYGPATVVYNALLVALWLSNTLSALRHDPSGTRSFRNQVQRCLLHKVIVIEVSLRKVYLIEEVGDHIQRLS